MRFSVPPWHGCRLMVALVAILGGTFAATGEPLVQVTEAPRAMVVAGHPQATAAGLEVLAAGGNAYDAAVAVALALGVAEPYGSGLGGKLYLVGSDPHKGGAFALDAMDAAGAALTGEAFADLTPDEEREGPTAVIVPGNLPGLAALHAEGGALPWGEVVAPAARLAAQGFVVLPKTRAFIAERQARLRHSAEALAVYLPAGTAPLPGTLLPSPNHLLQDLLEAPRDEAVEILASALDTAALPYATGDDLRAYQPREVAPLTVTNGPWTFVASGPPTLGGSIVALALAALAPADFPTDDRAAQLDLIARALQQAYARMVPLRGDYPEAAALMRAQLTPAVIRAARAALTRGTPTAPFGDEADEEAALVPVMEAPDSRFASTTHFVVADADGRIISATQSLSHHFGSGVSVRGVVLNNTLNNFSSSPQSRNHAAPRRRPFSTIAPLLVLREGQPYLAIGLPGGARIPAGIVQVVALHLFGGLPLEEAMAAPRLYPRISWGGAPPFHHLEAEAGFPDDQAEALRALGWKLDVRTDLEFFGGITALVKTPDGWRGYADRRRTNAASGL